MRAVRPYRLMLWSSAAALLLAGVVVWQEWQDRVNPILHGQRLSYWVADLDRIPAPAAMLPHGGMISVLMPPDYLQERPTLACARIVAFLHTRDTPTSRIYGWCEQHLPKRVLAVLPRPLICQHPRRVLGELSNFSFGADPVLRAELESLCQGPDAGLHEPAYRALFRDGRLRGFYTNLLEAAPVLAAGLQQPSGEVHKIVLRVLGELDSQHRLSEWPPNLPPLPQLLEMVDKRSSDLSLRFEVDGLLRDLGVKRPAAVAFSQPDAGSTPSEPSRLFKAVDWQSLNSSASSSLVLPPAAYVPGDKVRVKDFGDSISGGAPLHLRE